MKVFVAGASGAIGRRLVPLLVAGGYEVVGMTRSSTQAGAVRAMGADPVVADGLDGASLRQAVMRAEPEVVVHQMTGLSTVRSLKDLDEELAPTSRLRTEGTDNLLDAARAAGARRVIAQSYGLWNYLGGSRRPATEEDPLDPNPPSSMSRTLDAIRHVESVVPRAEDTEGIVLRYGFFYGPGTGFAENGRLCDLVRRRKMPIVGEGRGVWSFLHVDDAAAATMAAIRRGKPGVYNVADDDPAPVARLVARAREGAGGGAAAAPADVVRPDSRRGVRRVYAQPHPRHLERKGQGRAWMGSPLCELARWIPPRHRGHSRSSRPRGQGSWSSPRDEAGDGLGNGSGQPRGGVRLPRRARQSRAVHEPHAGRLALLGTPERGRGQGEDAAAKPGKPDWMDLEVIEADPPWRSREQTVSAGGRRRTQGTYILEELPGGGTRISFEFTWLRIPLLERLAAPVTRAVVRRGNERSLERLAEQLRRRQS